MDTILTTKLGVFVPFASWFSCKKITDRAMIQATCGRDISQAMCIMAQVWSLYPPQPCSVLAASPVRGPCWRSFHGPRPKRWHLVPLDELRVASQKRSEMRIPASWQRKYVFLGQLWWFWGTKLGFKKDCCPKISALSDLYHLHIIEVDPELITLAIENHRNMGWYSTKDVNFMRPLFYIHAHEVLINYHSNYL